jgi:ABC-type transporter Mla MlaB component
VTSTPANKQQLSADPSPPAVTVSGDGDHLALAGALGIATLAAARDALKKFSKQGSGRSLDIAGLDAIDTPGALFLCGLRDKGVELTGIRTEHQALLDLICGLELKPLPKVKSPPRWRQVVMQIGKDAHQARHEALDVITFAGRAASWTVSALLHPASLRPASIGSLTSIATTSGRLPGRSVRNCCPRHRHEPFSTATRQDAEMYGGRHISPDFWPEKASLKQCVLLSSPRRGTSTTGGPRASRATCGES